MKSYAYEYRFTGTQLGALVKALKERVTAYLSTLSAPDNLTVEVTARLPNDVPVAGKFTAVFAKKKK